MTAEPPLFKLRCRRGRGNPDTLRHRESFAIATRVGARLHALEGQRELAMRELAQGLARGHGEWRHIADEPDFGTLREDSEFQRLVTPPTDR